MSERTRVVVYGRSLSMAGLAASLRGAAGVEVVCVDPASPAARQLLNELHPVGVLFDLCDPALDLDITLLREQPGLLLIGVDPCSDEVLLLSSHPAQALSVADLLGVIAHRRRTIRPAAEETRQCDERSSPQPTCGQEEGFM